MRKLKRRNYWLALLVYGPTKEWTWKWNLLVIVLGIGVLVAVGLAAGITAVVAMAEQAVNYK